MQIGVDLAKKYRESKVSSMPLRRTTADVEAKTHLAQMCRRPTPFPLPDRAQDVRTSKTTSNASKMLEEIATGFEGVEKSYAIQAGREVRIMVKPEQVSDDKMVIIAHDIVKKVEEELKYPGQIKIHVIRESRAIDFAK